MNMVLKTSGNGNVCRASTRKRNVRIGFLGKIDMSKGFLSIGIYLWTLVIISIGLLVPLIKMNVYSDPLCNKSIYICPFCIGIHVESILIT